MSMHILDEFVSFVPGINPTRLDRKSDFLEEYYNQTEFINDYHGIDQKNKHIYKNHNLGLKRGDVVISTTLLKAAIVGENNVGKILTLNFIKVDFKSNQLDKKYFVYLFNEYKNIKKQKERELQGTGPMLKIPVKSLSKFKIPLPKISEQERIGEAYIKLVKLNMYIEQYKELINQSVITILENDVKEEEK